jgi:hypothetical protein
VTVASALAVTRVMDGKSLNDIVILFKIAKEQGLFGNIATEKKLKGRD